MLSKIEIGVEFLLPFLVILLVPFLSITGFVVFDDGYSLDYGFNTGIPPYNPSESVEIVVRFYHDDSEQFIYDGCNITVEGDEYLMDFVYNDTHYNYVEEVSFSYPGNNSFLIECSAENSTKNITGYVMIRQPNASFEDLNLGLTGVYQGSLAWGDVDGDEVGEMVVSGKNGESKIYNNNFASSKLWSINTWYNSLGLYDLFNNGKNNILLSGNFYDFEEMAIKNITRIYRKLDDNFIEYINLVGVFESSQAVGDLDRDGLLDIVVMGDTGDEKITYVYYGKDNYSSYDELQGLFRGAVGMFDVDSDGVLEIVQIGTYNDDHTGRVANISYYNNGFEKYQGLVGLYYSSFAYADFDNDGDIDIATIGSVSDESSGAKTILYRNNDGVFVNNQNLTGIWWGSITTGDYNNDGDIDLVITGVNTSGGKQTLYYLNNGTGWFELDMVDTGYMDSSIALYDYDNDGDLDLSMLGKGETVDTKVFKNSISDYIVNIAPDAPSIVDYTFDGTWLNLSWDKGSDDLTPENGLYYNLRVGSLPNGNDVVTGKFGGSANPTQGYLGNMMHMRNHSINVSENKTYFFQVQSIDSGLAKGDWSRIYEYNPCDGVYNINNHCVFYNKSGINQDVYVEATYSLFLYNTTVNSNVYSGASASLTIKGSNIDGDVSFYNNNTWINDTIISGNITSNGDNLTIVNSNYSSITGDYERYWYIDINATDLETGEGILGAVVNVSCDTMGNATTNSEGFARIIAKHDEVCDVVVSKYGYDDNTTSVTVDRTNVLDIQFQRFYPVVSEFDDNMTYDFTSDAKEDMVAVSDVYIGRYGVGQINFSGVMNVSGINLDEHIEIGSNSIYINGSVDELNRSANITFFNLDYSNEPLVLKDGVVCSSCNVLNYSDGRLVVEVDGFSTYTTTDNSLLSLSYGNLINDKLIPNQTIYFFANYSNKLSGVISGADCNITIDESVYDMNNYSNGLYNFSMDFETSGEKSFVVNCSEGDNEELSESMDFRVYPDEVMLKRGSEIEGYIESARMIVDGGKIIITGIDKNGDYVIDIYDYNLTHLENKSGVWKGSISWVDYNKSGKRRIIAIGEDKGDSEEAIILKED